jgi:hypothetical protein
MRSLFLCAGCRFSLGRFGELGKEAWLLLPVLSSEMSARGASGELGDDFGDVWKPLANLRKLSLRDFLSLSVDLESGDFDLESIQ